jgi:23S rRNA pseudouridine2605 synthase
MPRANNNGGRSSGRRSSSKNTSNFRSEKSGSKGPRKTAGKGKRDDGKKSFGKSERPSFSSKGKSAEDRNTGRFKKFSSTGGPSSRPRSNSRGNRITDGEGSFKPTRGTRDRGEGGGDFKKFNREDSGKRTGSTRSRSDRSEGGGFKKFNHEDSGKRASSTRSRSDRSEGGFKKFDREDSGKRTGSTRSRSDRSEGGFKKFDREDSRKRTGNTRSGSARSEGGFKKFSREDSGKRPGTRSRTEGGEGGFKKFNREDLGKRGENTRSGEGDFKKFDRPAPRKRTSETRSRDDRREDKDERSGFFNKQRRGDKESNEPSPDLNAPAQTGKIRLNRFIANSGVCSRREADELISMGVISVNGTTITELGYKVNPGDEVRHENRVLRAEKPVYILMNKPKGYLTTTDDPQERNTVMQLIGGSVKERIYPVGRLDRNTTGLLLLTNDGDLADKLMHPSYNAKKIYKVELDRPLNRADFETILAGVKLEEGRAMVDDLAIVSDDGKTVGIELHIGWNRVVRRIFESLEYQVVRLDRSVYAGLDKKNLGRGEWRFLTKEEIVRLKHYK